MFTTYEEAATSVRNATGRFLLAQEAATAAREELDRAIQEAYPTLSKAELARITGFARPTITALVGLARHHDNIS